MNTPILLLLFNRPNLTKKLILNLKKVKPKKIYINIDGPRKNNEEDSRLCKEVTDLIKKNINWKSKINFKINKKNFGCRNSVSKAINWFFSYEKYGIILEDDCIPKKTFFEFCTRMLSVYEYTNQIKVISGSNFQNKKINSKNYYFSKYAHCWGWATWRRSWKEFDNKMRFWKAFSESKKWQQLHSSSFEEKYWRRKFNLSHLNKIDSWAYPWLASVWYNNGLSITPCYNLVENIGFDSNATHTYGLKSKYNYEIQKNKKLNFFKKNKIKINSKADQFTFNNFFNGKYNFWPWRLIYFLKILCNSPSVFFHKAIKNIKLWI